MALAPLGRRSTQQDEWWGGSNKADLSCQINGTSKEEGDGEEEREEEEEEEEQAAVWAFCDKCHLMVGRRQETERSSLSRPDHSNRCGPNRTVHDCVWMHTVKDSCIQNGPKIKAIVLTLQKWQHGLACQLTSVSASLLTNSELHWHVLIHAVFWRSTERSG